MWCVCVNFLHLVFTNRMSRNESKRLVPNNPNKTTPPRILLVSVPDVVLLGREGATILQSLSGESVTQPRTIGGVSRLWGAIMPGHLQDGFGCIVTNRFDQLLDDESDPFEILKAAENRRKDAALPGAKAASAGAAQAGKTARREPQRERKNQAAAPEKKEEPQPTPSQKREGV